MKHQIIFILGLTAIGLVSGCGLREHGNPAVTTPADPFLATVQSLAKDAPENTEPIDIETVSVTTPEDGEPEDI